MRSEGLAAAFVAAIAVAACGGTSASGPPASDVDGGSANDATIADASPDAVTLPDALADAPADSASPSVGCGEFTGDTRFTCSRDGNSRGKCVGDASLVVEPCPRGCLRVKGGADDVCLGTTDTFSCTGSYGTTPSTSGDYYLTAFGCWVDSTGVIHTDPADNCIPSCLSQAKAAGLCTASDTGPQCEERVSWFTADGARFGCLARLRMTNPANNKTVVAAALDFGPGCTGENAVSKEVIDASGLVDRYLFGSDQGASDHALIHVVEVDKSTPLGPVP